MRGFTKVTDPIFYNRDQSWFATAEFKHTKTGKVVRVKIRRNSYDAQSYKSVAIFDLAAGSWHQFSDIPLNNADACYSVSYTDRELSIPQRQKFTADFEPLLLKVGVVLDAALAG